MPSRSDDAIVLTRYPFRERDLIAVLLTRTSGQLRVLARRARGARRVEATGLEPLNRVRVTYFERPDVELARLVEVDTVRAAFPLAQHPEAWAAGQVIAELALTYVPAGQRQEAQFRLADTCLEALASGLAPLAACHYAELWFLRLGGVFPALDACVVCGKAPTSAGFFYDVVERACECPEHRSPSALRLSGLALQWLGQALRSPVEEVRSAAPADAAEWLATLRRQFTERELLSMRYLKRLLAEDRSSTR
jgi:DNA repair protein RecO